MNRRSAGAFLTAVCTVISVTTPVLAVDGNSKTEHDDSTVIRLYSTEGRLPIGIARVASLNGGVFAIDGRVAMGEQLVWGGEMIEAPEGAGANIALDSLGRIGVAPRSSIRLGAFDALRKPNHVSFALLNGSVTLRLASASTAAVTASNMRFAASPGASFRIAAVNGAPELTTFSGEVRVEEQTPSGDVNIRIVDDLGRPVAAGSQFSIRARSTRQIQVQVTDKNDKPLPDVPVLFSLGSPCLGSIGLGAGSTFQKKTDKRGLAAVVLTAGAAKCAGSIIARVEGTNASVEIKTNVEERQGFWSTRNSLIVGGALAGAGVGIGLAVANSGSSEPIRPVPPPGVKP